MKRLTLKKKQTSDRWKLNLFSLAASLLVMLPVVFGFFRNNFVAFSIYEESAVNVRGIYSTSTISDTFLIPICKKYFYMFFILLIFVLDFSFFWRRNFLKGAIFWRNILQNRSNQFEGHFGRLRTVHFPAKDGEDASFEEVNVTIEVYFLPKSAFLCGCSIIMSTFSLKSTLT